MNNSKANVRLSPESRYRTIGRTNPSLALRIRAVLFAGLFTLPASAISPAELQQSLERGEALTVIDIRSTVLFQKGHIPGAINVPAALVPEKKLPRLGRVIVCDDGLGRETAGQAVAELNRKPGIRAESLEGGFAAWESLTRATTRAGGLAPEELNLITYDQLARANFNDLVLVDLRRPRPQVRQGAEETAIAPPLTDLRKEYPQARITQSPFDLPQSPQSAQGASVAPLLVLIDDGDGAARETARTLKANGITRFVILAGGEEILSRHGQPGLQRAGASLSAEPK